MQTIDPRRDLAAYTFLSKYARYRPDLKRRETHNEAVDRVMAMHRRKYQHQIGQEVFEQVEQALKQDRILPSQRTMQFAGPAIERINLRGFNCTASAFNRPRFLAEAVWLLLCGCGVGFSVQKHHVAQLPRLHHTRGTHTHVVEDSIEGWADAFDALLMSHINGTGRVAFDYSKVRPAGTSLSTSSAKAPGPKPLRDSLEACRKLLSRVVQVGGGVLHPIDAYDLVMHAVGCVRAGGVRRSATIALFSPDDEEMRNAKTGNWFKENPQRRRSNNSAQMVRDTATREQFSLLMQATREFGEPGVVFSQSTEHSTNPCAEAGFDLVDETTGELGWSFCNCTSVNVAACEDRAAFLEACVDAGVLGTLQAGYMDMGYLGNDSAAGRIMRRDALLGVSLTGMADNQDIAFDTELLRAGVDLIRDANQRVAAAIGINTAARLTFLKPEGSGSLRLRVASGITPHHARRFLRYAEGGPPTDPLVMFLQKHIPEAVVPSAYDPTEVKLVFPIDLGDGPLWLKQDTAAVDHLMRVKAVQEAWVIPGTNRGDLTHNVSNTVVVKPGEWAHVEDTIWRHRDVYGGVSLLGSFGDLDYPQCPFIEVLSGDEIQAKYGNDPERREKALAVADQYSRLRAAWVNLDWTELREDEDLTGGTEIVVCAGGACLV